MLTIDKLRSAKKVISSLLEKAEFFLASSQLRRSTGAAIILVLSGFLYGLNDSGQFLFEKSIEIYKEKFVFEERYGLSLDNIDCRSITDGVSDCLSASYSLSFLDSATHLWRVYLWISMYLLGLLTIIYLLSIGLAAIEAGKHNKAKQAGM